MPKIIDLWAYDLSGNKPTKQDIKEAHKHNLHVEQPVSVKDGFILIGNVNDIYAYVERYIGVQVLNDYLYWLGEN